MSNIQATINDAQHKIVDNDEFVYSIQEQCVIYRALDVYFNYVRIFGTEKEEQKLDQIKKELL